MVILQERDDWYYGHTQANEAHKGIFPKAYVHIRNTGADNEPLVEEINSSLKEWNEILKQKFLEEVDDMKSPPDYHYLSLKAMQGIMKDVTGNRSKLATGRLAAREAKDTRKKIIAKTDFLNLKLKLDLVVRDDEGNLLLGDK